MVAMTIKNPQRGADSLLCAASRSKGSLTSFPLRTTINDSQDQRDSGVFGNESEDDNARDNGSLRLRPGSFSCRRLVRPGRPLRQGCREARQGLHGPPRRLSLRVAPPSEPGHPRHRLPPELRLRSNLRRVPNRPERTRHPEAVRQVLRRPRDNVRHKRAPDSDVASSARGLSGSTAYTKTGIGHRPMPVTFLYSRDDAGNRPDKTGESATGQNDKENDRTESEERVPFEVGAQAVVRHGEAGRQYR